MKIWKKREQRDKKVEFSEKKLALANFKVIEELEKLGSKRNSTKRKK